jgi:hypothetical protein
LRCFVRSGSAACLQFTGRGTAVNFSRNHLQAINGKTRATRGFRSPPPSVRGNQIFWAQGLVDACRQVGPRGTPVIALAI